MRKEWPKKFIESNIRRNMRFSRYGEDLEDHVASILQEMKALGKIADFVKHAKHSKEDESGKDFTVTGLSGKTESFGVTISKRSHNRSKNLHSDVLQMHFPIGTNKSTIVEKILRAVAP